MIDLKYLNDGRCALPIRRISYYHIIADKLYHVNWVFGNQHQLRYRFNKVFGIRLNIGSSWQLTIGFAQNWKATANHQSFR